MISVTKYFHHFFHEVFSVCLASCKASVANHLAKDCEQNWATCWAVEEACPDNTKALSLDGGAIGLNTLLISSSGKVSSPEI